MKGNANLCRAIVRAGARLGVTNNQGINIFNYQVATKQLLFRLLGGFPLPDPGLLNCILVYPTPWSLVTSTVSDMLTKEPPWCDGSNCFECAAKFGVTTRKHHWLVDFSLSI